MALFLILAGGVFLSARYPCSHSASFPLPAAPPVARGNNQHLFARQDYSVPLCNVTQIYFPVPYRGTSHLHENPSGPVRRHMPRVLCGSWAFLMGEIPLRTPPHACDLCQDASSFARTRPPKSTASLEQCYHKGPYVGVSRLRSWSHLFVLGAISWAFIAKN